MAAGRSDIHKVRVLEGCDDSMPKGCTDGCLDSIADENPFDSVVDCCEGLDAGSQNGWRNG
jgi:hypothetical protein